MSITGRTLVRFCGALVLGLAATAIDHPGGLAWLTPRRIEPPAAPRIVQQGARPGLGTKITPGKRAYAIRIDGVASVAGMIQPNSRVDIMVVLYDSAASRRVARLFMSNMRVLAIGAVPSNGPDRVQRNVTVATIEVTPEEVERLAIAGARASFQLVLRGYGAPDSIWTSSTVAPARDLLLRRYAPSRSAPDSVRVTLQRAPR